MIKYVLQFGGATVRGINSVARVSAPVVGKVAKASHTRFQKEKHQFNEELEVQSEKVSKSWASTKEVFQREMDDFKAFSALDFEAIKALKQQQKDIVEDTTEVIVEPQIAMA